MRELIEYISRWQPDFTTRIEGASPAEVERLQELAEVPFPSSYRLYLESFGRRNGGLNFSFGGRVTAPELIDLQERCLASSGSARLEAQPEGTLLIGVAPQPGYLIVMQGDWAGEPAVWFAEDDLTDRYADSLTMLLFRLAFVFFRLPALAAREVYTETTTSNGFEKACSVAESLGFRGEWFSDSVSWCGEQPGAAIEILQYGTGNAMITLAAHSAEFVSRLGAKLMQQMPVSPESDYRPDSPF